MSPRFAAEVSVISLAAVVAIAVVWAASYHRPISIEVVNQYELCEIRVDHGLLTAGNCPQLAMEQVWQRQRSEGLRRANRRVDAAVQNRAEIPEFDRAGAEQPSPPALDQAFDRAQRRAAADQEIGDATLALQALQRFNWPPLRASTPRSFSLKCRTALAASAVPLLLICGSALQSLARRSRARRRSQCTRCGYDLRASKERCPECGTPIQSE